ncbi:MAG: hypothetical protein LBR61_09735 [Synergistaceae bacterium]|jgi:hypothetical protein|nr:hypothetical protein [Synergistaceae bacterium]
MTRDELSSEEIRDLICAPEPTDDPDDFDFDEGDDDFSGENERDFIKRWLREDDEPELAE